MRFLPWWQGRHHADPAGNRLVRFRKVLEAALEVSAYEVSLRGAGIAGRRDINRVTAIQPVLRRMGVFNLDQIRVRRDSGDRTGFHSPLPLAAGYDLSWNVEGCVVLRPQHAVLLRTGLDDGLLSPMERDGLWLRYGLPMFEHLTGMDGGILAWECEAHSGLHVVEENVVLELVQGELLLTSLTDLVQPTIQVRTGWAARIENDTCDCGRPGYRLSQLHQFATRTAIAAHA